MNVTKYQDPPIVVWWEGPQTLEWIRSKGPNEI